MIRTAFYPCCGTDITVPRQLLCGIVERIVFCDVHPHLTRWAAAAPKFQSPEAEFVVGDAREVVAQIPVINVLFYRRDSLGEGGSGVFVLGDVFLRDLISRFPQAGGLIVSDGSNSRGGNFKRMIRKNGLLKFERSFSVAASQPFIQEHGLWCIEVGASPV